VTYCNAASGRQSHRQHAQEICWFLRYSCGQAGRCSTAGARVLVEVLLVIFERMQTSTCMCVSLIGLVSFILSLLFEILTMDTLSEINLMDGWIQVTNVSH